MVNEYLRGPTLVYALLAILCCVASNAPLAADTYPRQPGIDLLEYIFRIELNDESDRIQGLTTLDVQCTQEGVSDLALDLIGQTEEGKGMDVSGVWVAGHLQQAQATASLPARTDLGTHTSFDHSEDRLRFELPSECDPGQRLFVTVAYGGIPVTGLEIGETKHGDRSFFSENWPNRARHWLPTIDHPYDKAMGRMVVTAPSHYQVVSNGLLVEETDLDGDTSTASPCRPGCIGRIVTRDSTTSPFRLTTSSISSPIRSALTPTRSSPTFRATVSAAGWNRHRRSSTAMTQ
jgi:hypothetical protein